MRPKTVCVQKTNSPAPTGLVTPTPERLARSEFVGTGPMRVLRTVQALLNAGDITQTAADAAEQWYQDYVFGYFDYNEVPPGYQPSTLTRHDAVSWQLVRGKAMARVEAVRAALGLCAHQRLRMLLVDELSFRAMGVTLFPTLSASSAQRKIAAQCALLLEQLDAFAQTARKAAQQARKNRRVGNSPISSPPSALR